MTQPWRGGAPVIERDQMDSSIDEDLEQRWYWSDYGKRRAGMVVMKVMQIVTSSKDSFNMAKDE